jgi:hypothetical protein
VWLAVAGLALALVVATLPDFLREASTIALPDQRTFSQLSPAELALLRRWGLPPGAYTAFVLAWTLSPLLVYILVAAVIFQRSPEPGVAFWMSLMLVGIGAAMPYLGGITDFSQAWQGAVHAVRALGLSLLLGLFLIFPTGQFVPWWTRPLAGLWVLWMLFWLLVPQSAWVLLDKTGAFTPLGLAAMLLGFGAGIYAQVYRYRRISTSLQRQQAKVFAFGFSLTFGLYILAVAPFFLLPGARAPGLPYFLYGLVYVPLLTRLAFINIPLLIGFAILRYRLWDIDLIIRRTLIYTLVTGALALVYAGTVVVLQPVFAALTGQPRSGLSTVLSTLAVAALFGPLRGRVQRLIDRRFYRRKYDASRALASFSSTLADEVDVQRLTEQLENVIGETLQPAHVWLWLKPRATDPAAADRRPAAAD